MIVGSGNGQLLFILQAAGYLNLSGCDFSPASIELSTAIAKERQVTDINFLRRDVIAGEMKDDGFFGLICDKGTYDAISLSNETIDDRALRTFYPKRVADLLSPDGVFLITSCECMLWQIKRNRR